MSCPRCNYCGADANPSGMCDSCDKRMNGTTHAERVAKDATLDPAVVEMRRIDAGFTLNAGNGSKLAYDMHDLAYWGMLPKSYL